MYPVRIRVNDPLEIDILKDVCNFRAIRVKDKNIPKKIGHKIPRSVKRDGFIIHDGVIAITNPKIKMYFEPAYGKKHGYDFIFKTIF